MSSDLTVAGFFAGCGGLDLGFKNAGFQLKWANELEPTFADSYKSATTHDCVSGDFWQVSQEVPSSDIIIGGPPCQSFSLVGKRLHDDPRGKLVAGFVELILERRPKGFLIENVAGLASSFHNGRRLPEVLAEEFSKNGYQVLVERVDASDFFVPQRRKRLIIVGVQDSKKKLEIISPNLFANALEKRTGIKFPPGKVSVLSALDDLPSPSITKGEMVGYRSSPLTEYMKMMRLDDPLSVSLQEMPTMSTLDKAFVEHIPPGGNYRDIPDEISTTRIMKFKSTGGRTTTYGRLAPNSPAYTINTYFNRPNVGANYHYSEKRLITVREALRLQSFPDNFTPSFQNQRQLHVQIGNAVPPLLAEALAISIRRAIGE